MKVKFIGAIERVTGSCAWLKHKDTEFLIDCGMIQGEKYSTQENSKNFPFKPNNLKFVLLTHAHLDHCGLIPKLYKDGFTGLVYCTKATARLAKEIMRNSCHIDAPYTMSDVSSVNFRHVDELEDFKWGKFIPVDENISFNFFHSAHILGAVSIGLSWFSEKATSILFTGDIGNNVKSNAYQPLLKARQSPHKSFDYIVCESTYGARNRDLNQCDFNNRIEMLENQIVNTLHKKQGDLLIPTFSMHRTQEIIFDLFYILNVKWKGNLKKGVYKLPIVDFLKTTKITDPSISIPSKEIDKFMLDESLPMDFKLAIKECYLPCFHLRNERYEILKSEFSDIDFESIKVVSTYTVAIRERDIGCDVEIENIQSYLEENDLLPSSKYFIFDEGEWSKRKDKFCEYFVDIKEEPVKVFYDSALGHKISDIYGDELISSYKKGSENKKLYINGNIKKWLSIDSDVDVDNTIKNLFQNKFTNIGVHSINKVKYNGKPYSKKPSIIISSPGMCHTGLVHEHLNRLLTMSANTILLTGYQSPNTTGSVLQNIPTLTSQEKVNQEFTLITRRKDTNRGKGKKIRNKEEYDEITMKCSQVKAEIGFIFGYSGHADQESLLKYLFTEETEYNSAFTIPNIIINHGDNTSRQQFKNAILKRSEEFQVKYSGASRCKTNVLIPNKLDSWLSLDDNEWVSDELVEKKDTSDNNELVNMLRELTESVKELKVEISEIKRKIFLSDS